MAVKTARIALRPTISQMAFALICIFVSLYFGLAAIAGPSGIMRRDEVLTETVRLIALRDEKAAEYARMQNLTKRLSPGYLDLDLLDERARDVLGYMREDEIMLPAMAE